MFGTEGGWGFGMGLGMLLFWVVLIVIVIALVKIIGAGTGSQTGTPDKSPMEILRTRFASGEIDEKEFERRRRELEK